MRWLWYADPRGQPRQVKHSFTDLAEPDEFVRQAAGQCVFHLRDLAELVGVAERIGRRLAADGNG